MVRRIFHHTNFWHALRIINSGKFYSSVRINTKGDSGMNCYLQREPTAYNIHSGNGAIIEFSWMGNETENDEKMMEPEWLVHFGSWRSVVTLGTSVNLKATNLYLDNNSYWKEYICKSRRIPLLTIRRKRWVENEAKNMDYSIKSRLKEGINISVV